MWERIDSLLERAPHVEALRLHRVELLEARRRRAAGLATGELADDEAMAIACDLAAIPLLSRVRQAWDGRLVLLKGPEVALDYPGGHLRPFRDLDLLADDAEAAQAALIAAGFKEVDDPAIYRDIHHLRPLWWPGLPLVIELHKRPKWVEGVPAPTTQELLASAVPGRLGIDGVGALPPAHHALLLAAHAWEHQPLGRLGNLIDVAVTMRRADIQDIEALARRWDCSRLWRTTHGAVDAVLERGRGSAGVALWGRHLRGVRERTVLEWHIADLLAPAWCRPPRQVVRAVMQAALADARREGAETRREKLRRTRLAVRHAAVARSDHRRALDARGLTAGNRTEAG